MTQYQAHTNLESVRECPFCEEEVLSRGLYVHVYNSDDDAHGPRGEVPDDFSVDDAEITGRREVTVNTPTKYRVDHRRFVCDYCGKTFKGQLGLNVHLGRRSGADDLHPADAEDRDISTFESYPATEDGKLIVTDPSDAEGIHHEEGIIVADQETVDDMERERDGIQHGTMVPLQELERLYLKFIDDAENDRDITPYHAAERVDNIIERYRGQDNSGKAGESESATPSN
ncbi:hypothetical protein [Halorubellus litoreus]|uniref:C2H2-type domain-containing protein n=1 Tax=Halorubellus litoreus TaxID=755308 RepID=A0ABD5VHT1_9EURY